MFKVMLKKECLRAFVVLFYKVKMSMKHILIIGERGIVACIF